MEAGMKESRTRGRAAMKRVRAVRKEIQDRIEAELRRRKKEREWMEKEDDREDVIEAKFVSRMIDCGYMHLKADRLRRGWSDQIFFGHGPRTIIVEFKSHSAREGRRGEKLQEYYRNEFRERGYEVYRVKGWHEADITFFTITHQELRGKTGEVASILPEEELKKRRVK